MVGDKDEGAQDQRAHLRLALLTLQSSPNQKFAWRTQPSLYRNRSESLTHPERNTKETPGEQDGTLL